LSDKIKVEISLNSSGIPFWKFSVDQLAFDIGPKKNCTNTLAASSVLISSSKLCAKALDMSFLECSSMTGNGETDEIM